MSAPLSVATRRLLAALVCALAAVAAPRLASAQAEVCIPPAYGVPGMPGGPDWLAASPLPRTELNDPRWAGASRIYFPNDTGTALTEASVRTVAEGNILTISFQTLADPSMSNNDTIWLGIGKNAANAALSGADIDFYLLQVRLAGNTNIDASPYPVPPTDPANNVTAWTRSSTASSWTQAIDDGPWATEKAYWVNSGGAVKWAINVKFDLSLVGMSATSNGKLFVASFVETALTQGWIHQWPNAAVPIADPTNPVVAFTQTAVNPASWGTTKLSTYASPCAAGISLNWAQIGAAPAPDNIINVPGSADSTTNDFYATPTWNSVLGESTAGSIKAHMRLADWGSIATPADWDLIVTQNRSSDTSGDIHFPCPVGTAGCGSLPAGDNHQCMLVELEKGPTPPAVANIFFENDSAYRNMDFGEASRFERTATISIKGLPALANATHRDTYIWVKTINMPEPGEDRLYLPKKDMSRAFALAKNPPRGPIAAPDPEGREKPGVAGAAAAADAPKPLDPDTAQDGFEHMTNSWPTYEVHVYHDTGRFIVVHGTKYQLLQPQTPFGYFIDHDGELYGFEHSLEGVDGAKLEQVGPDFYRLSIENGKSAKVKTTIVAHEKSVPKADKCCVVPPAKVVIQPRCYCSMPGVGGGGAYSWLALVLVGLSYARRKLRSDVS